MNDRSVETIHRGIAYDRLPEYLSPEEFRSYVGLSRNTMYELLRRNQVAHVRFGRSIRIPKTSLRLPPASRIR